MNNRIPLCLAFVLSGVSYGCSTATSQGSRGVADSGTIGLPVTFAGYREFYTFVAKRTYGGMSTDADTLFKLAADSTTTIITLEDKQMPYVYLVESHYYNGGIYDQIRGAQGNGDYYILRPRATNYTDLDTDKGFELVGIAEGNSCKLTYSNSNGKPRFVTHWHLSVDESPERIYEWNGRFFEELK